MSIVTYNGVTLPYAFVTDLQQNVIYDPSSTDAIYIQFDITVQTIINPSYLQVYTSDFSVAGAPANANPSDIMKYIRTKLMQPRERLSYVFNGVDLIPNTINPGSGTFIDAMNGPKPQYCRIFPATNNTFLMQYRVIAHYHECNQLISGGTGPQVFPVNNQPGNDVLYNRWSERVDLDNLQFTRRVRNGKYVIRSDNVDGFIADELRSSMAVLGVPYGFLRESSSYVVDPSGLAIEYEIIDKEQFKMPPPPAFRARGEFFETSVINGGGRPGKTLEARVTLEGDKATDQMTLVEKAVEVAAVKVYAVSASALSAVGAGTAIPQSLTVNVDMYENKVEARFRAWLSVRTQDVYQGVFGLSNYMTFTPGSDGLPQGTSVQPKYYDRGTANFLLQAAAYWDPCLRPSALNAGTGQVNTLKTGQLPGTGGPDTPGTVGPGAGPGKNPGTSSMSTGVPVSITTRPLNPNGQNSLKTTKIIGNGDSAWTDFEVRLYYEKDRHIYMMPVAATGGFQGNTAAFVQLASPTLLLIADWTASRIGEQPIVPDPNSGNKNLVLMDDQYELANLGLDGGGLRAIYRISGTYVYGHKSPPEPTALALKFPIAPWIDDGTFDRTMPPIAFAQGIID